MTVAVTVSPADLNGTAALSWRYRDASKRDSNWAYVPALRRVRAVSPANRSDGFLGSDMSQDDGEFFDGKTEDFTWTLKDETDQFRIVDPLSLKGQGDVVWLSTGGWRTIWPDLKLMGYMDPAWKGLAWAPLLVLIVVLGIFPNLVFKSVDHAVGVQLSQHECLVAESGPDCAEIVDAQSAQGN